MIKQRRRNRSSRETIDDLKRHTDAAQGLLIDANARIVKQFKEIASLRRRLDELEPSAKVVSQF
jgi:hypothetical protein